MANKAAKKGARAKLSRGKGERKAFIDDLSDWDVEVLMQIPHRFDEWEATQEILNSPELMKAIGEGLRDVEAGRVTEWHEMKHPT